METRRFILALSLSLLVFVTYVKFFAPKPVEVPPTEQTKTATAAEQKSDAPKQPASRPVVAAKIETAARGRDIVIETDLLKATVNTAGGVITSWELKNFREADKTPVGLVVLYKKLTGQAKEESKPKKPLGNVQLLPVYDGADPGAMVKPLTLVPLDPALYKLAAVEYRADLQGLLLSKEHPSGMLTLVYSGPGGLSIEKKLAFSNDSYHVNVSVSTKGLDGYTFSLGTDFGLADKVSKDSEGRVGFVGVVDTKFVSEKITKINGELQYPGAISWFGQNDKYFTAAILNEGNGIVTSKKTSGAADSGDLLTTTLTVKEKPEQRTFGLYAGPKSFRLLEAQGSGMEQMVDYGWFAILAKPMFWLLTAFYNVMRNYGIAIILLTLVVRALLFYPSLKSAKAMEEMKRIQPQVLALKEKFKKDPAKMNQEMMRLYKEHKVNPLGGCLPMLMQLPFFVALYNVLSVSIELRQAPFISFWIKDLSVFDPFYILPVLMGVSMVFTMKMTSSTVDPQQAKIMMFMNIAFIFLFAWLPAGLLLYITLSNVLSIVQQLYVRRILGLNVDMGQAGA
jgi:YidC/Oxa1 family membrane protein insertase